MTKPPSYLEIGMAGHFEGFGGCEGEARLKMAVDGVCVRNSNVSLRRAREA